MKDELDLIKDYKDCLNYIKNFNQYAPEYLSSWVDVKYIDWVNKNILYAFSPSVLGTPPNNNTEKAYNKLNNFKITLENIATIKGIKLAD